MIKARILGLALAAISGEAVASVGQADAAYQENRTADARRLYRAVVQGGGGSPDDRAKAHRELARICWLIDGRADEALRHVSQAERAGAQRCEVTLEYQAKLSELALSDYPRMALWNLNRIGGEGPHDRANSRVMQELSDWMRAHASQVIGYDPGLPAQAQLDKLTDEQLREIARGLDPLAQAAATPSADSPSGKSTRSLPDTRPRTLMSPPAPLRS